MAQSPLARGAVTLLFVGMLGAVWALERQASGAGAGGTRALAFALRDVSKEVGIDFRHTPTTLDPKLENIAPHVSAMGASIAVVDFDSDGWSDLYATTSRFGKPNALYRNRGDGTFEDVAERAGLAQLNREGEGVSMGSIWADFDNDGHVDALVYKWGQQQLLRNRGDGTFEDVSERSGVRRWMNSNGAAWFDYDRDGFVDLYLAGYFRGDIDLWNLKSTRIMQSSFEFATNGGDNVLLRNRGDGTFEDVTARTGTNSTRWTLAVAAADMDGDGWCDLYLANDYGPEELFRNVGGERFERLSGIGLEESSKSGMSVTLGDFENSGRFGVFVTNISKERFLFQGNNLRQNLLAERGRLLNVTEDTSAPRAREVVNCGWAWGAQFGDLDNDGWLDLFVTNGFVSANPERDYWYGMSKVAGGAGGVFEDATKWEPMGDRSLSGYERSRVLLGCGACRFEDVALAAGVDDVYDGRAVAFADLFKRGVLDAIVANQNGPLLIYRNEVDPARNWIQFELRASVSNRSAIGAELTLHYGERRQVQAVLAGNGFCSQNEHVLHFGLGAAERVDKAVVRWPNGATSTWLAKADGAQADLQPGELRADLAVRRRHVLEEPRP
jgi:hypothetical protein